MTITKSETEVPSLNLQIIRLLEQYPQLSPADMFSPEKPLDDAVGWRWCAFPNIWKEDSPLPGSYNEQAETAAKIVLGENFQPHNALQLGEARLRQSDSSLEAWKSVSAAQNHPDILVVAAQPGTAYYGISVERARRLMTKQAEFGLGVFASSTILLTDPNLIATNSHQRMVCAGDECFSEWGLGAHSTSTPYFQRDHYNHIGLGIDWIKNTSDSSGAATAKLPE